MIATTHGPMDEAQLLKHAFAEETDDQRLEVVEYCRIDCGGLAHQTGVPQAIDCFCPHHIHRSVAVIVKRWPEGCLDGVSASFT